MSPAAPTSPTRQPPPARFGGSPLAAAVGLLALLAALCALAYGIYRGVDSIVPDVVDYVPISVDQRLGKLAASQVEASERVCDNPELQRAVVQVVDALRPALPAQWRDVHVEVLDDDAVNAFALPGGHVFVLSGLLQEIESPDELAGVLAHELAHVTLRHGMRALLHSMFVRVALYLVVGNWTRMGDVLAAHTATLVNLRHSREAEAQADAEAVRILAAVGLDPRALARFLAKLPDTGIEWLGDHPLPHSRVEAVERLAAALPLRTPPAPLPPLAALRAPCRLVDGARRPNAGGMP